MTGLEPANTGTTIRGLNHLATPAIKCVIHIITRFPTGPSAKAEPGLFLIAYANVRTRFMEGNKKGG